MTGTGRTAAAAAPRSAVTGAAMLTGSGLSNQLGAALGALAFGPLGTSGVVAIRQLVSAAILLPVARPRLRSFTWAQWWPALLLGVVLATMNLSLYGAVDRIGLGLAVTLEFLGPLAVALCASRTKADLLLAAGAAVGVYVLLLPDASSDILGYALGLLAACCWASYILLNRMLGGRLSGLQAPATATLVSSLLTLPITVQLIAEGRLLGWPLLLAALSGVLCSVIPYSIDVIALRWVTTRFFGVFMSINPMFAALAGVVVLGQVPAAHEWIGMAMIVAVNAVAVSRSLRGSRVAHEPRDGVAPSSA
ncbi:EamA family transporter [Pseudoclavibacter sp. RFBI5]|uniref:EamA family transporter n=1 Tax=Pseudoclavibacter sp. RFBI5 TaxID=2080578 RepID=UPI000CE8AEDD|nr:EamA family transporter [Pseudoclavibacter sp. RFBI5]PPG01525.1 EamA family transporter [Pseudoclavibacter sp. RFBI5]